MLKKIISIAIILIYASVCLAVSGLLKQSTATTLEIGPFYNISDAVRRSDLTIHYDHVELSLNGGTPWTKHDANNVSANGSNGYYLCKLDTTDTASLGLLRLDVYDTNSLIPVFNFYNIVTANVYDSIYSTSKLQVDVVKVRGTETPEANHPGAFAADLTYVLGEIISDPNKYGYIPVIAEWKSDGNNVSRPIKLSGASASINTDSSGRVLVDPNDKNYIAELAQEKIDSNSIILTEIKASIDELPAQITDAVLDAPASEHETFDTIGWLLKKLRRW